MTMENNLKKYYENGFYSIEGWCDAGLFGMLNVLDSCGINKSGGCLEIGVHHGKFYCMLNSLIEPNYLSYAVDVFDDQHLNIDSSGRGNLEIFKRNLLLYDKHEGKNTKILPLDSTDPKLRKELDPAIGTLRYISIDGGHTPEHSLSDLKLSNDLISNQGVVFLDDILHPRWMGVLEGAIIFLKNKPTLVPFAIGYNKLFLCKLSYQTYYYELVMNSSLKKDCSSFFGHKIVII